MPDLNDKLKQGTVLWGTKNIFKVIPHACSGDEMNTENKSSTSATSGAEKMSDALDSSRIVECRVKGKRSNIDPAHTYLLAGDEVRYTETDEGYGMVVERLARKNSILRRKNDLLQPIAVNIDLLIIVCSLFNPPFRPRFVDRLVYIAKCESIDILLVVNKIDLCMPKDARASDEDSIADSNSVQTSVQTSAKTRMKNDMLPEMKKKKIKTDSKIETYIPEEMHARLCVYEEIGVDILYTSTLEMIGIADLEQRLRGKQSAIVGQSGVGKTSLINVLVPDVQRQTGAISEKYDRGRHVTTRPEIVYGKGFRLIDTPGIRELYPEHVDMTTLIEGYPDIYRYAQECKLPNCSHRNEPNCAVQEHIGESIHSDRYESYVRLREAMEKIESKKWVRQVRKKNG